MYFNYQIVMHCNILKRMAICIAIISVIVPFISFTLGLIFMLKNFDVYFINISLGLIFMQKYFDE